MRVNANAGSAVRTATSGVETRRAAFSIVTNCSIGRGIVAIAVLLLLPASNRVYANPHWRSAPMFKELPMQGGQLLVQNPGRCTRLRVFPD
jgi:hypothetical protein